MENSQVSSLAIALSIVGLVVSGLSAIFAASQSESARRATALATVQTFMTETRTLWRECGEIAKSEPADSYKFQICIENILGHFEFACALLSENYVKGKLYELIEDTIVDYIDLMSKNKYHPFVAPITNQAHVCINLKDFCIQRSGRFADRSSVFNLLNIPGA